MRRALGVLALCAGCGDASEPEPGEPSGPPVRVVLVSLDTLRADHFTPARMPRTHARARAGRRFTRHYSASASTQPTHATVFTGLGPWRHGVSRNGVVLAEERRTLAERLRERGFETRAVVASYVLHPHFGFAQGFDEYVAERAPDAPDAPGAPDAPDAPATPGHPGVPSVSFLLRADLVIDRALGALAAMTGPRQFLFVHLVDAHAPYNDGDAHPVHDADVGGALHRGEEVTTLVARAREGYARDVAFLDQHLERLFTQLERSPVPTHVVVFADHGESLGEGARFGHGKHLSPEQVRVPLFVLSPRVAAGVQDTPVGSADVFATVLSLAGLEPEGSPARDLSAAAIPAGPVLGMRRSFVGPYRERLLDGSVEVLDGPRFYVVDGEHVYAGHAAAIEGVHGTAAPLPARARRIGALFARLEAELGGRGEPAAIGDEARAALEALGYGR